MLLVAYSSVATAAAIFCAHSLHTFCSLTSMISSQLLQKMQEGEYFLRMILSSSINTSSDDSELTIPRVLLSSIGITNLPTESTLLTIPVDFTVKSPFLTEFVIIISQWQKIVNISVL